MLGSVADVEAVPAAEVPSVSCGQLVVDNDAAAKRTKWVSVKVEGGVKVFPGR